MQMRTSYRLVTVSGLSAIAAAADRAGMRELAQGWSRSTWTALLLFGLFAVLSSAAAIAIWKLFCADARDAMECLRSEPHKELTPLLLELRRDRDV